MTLIQLLALATTIKNETVDENNSATRIGVALESIITYFNTHSGGASGLTIVSGAINSEGHLIFTMSDNSTIDCGEIDLSASGKVADVKNIITSPGIDDKLTTGFSGVVLDENYLDWGTRSFSLLTLPWGNENSQIQIAFLILGDNILHIKYRCGAHVVDFVWSWTEWKEFSSGGGGSTTLTTPFIVNLSSGKFGKLANGTYNEAIGKTPEEWMRYAAFESINPTASVSAAGSIPYNSSTGTITISLAGSSNNPGGTITNMTLSYRRGGGAFTQIYNGVSKSSHTHIVDSLLAGDKVSNFYYQLVVTDSIGATVTVTSNVITPAAYAYPSVSAATNDSQEIGNIVFSANRTVSKNSPNTTLTSWQLIAYVNGGAAVAIGTPTAFVNQTSSDVIAISITADGKINGQTVAGLVDATSVVVKVKVIDSVTTGGVELTTFTRSLDYKKFYGTTAAAVTDYRALTIVANGVTSHVWYAGGKVHSIAVPASKSLVSVMTSNNENVTSNFALVTANIPDGNGNARSYHIYTMTTAVDFNVTLTAITN